jgi:hypothetical protein
MKAFQPVAAIIILTACNGNDVAVSAAQPPAQAPAPSPTPPASSTPAPPPADCTMQPGSFQLVATGFTTTTAGMALYKYYPCDKLAHIFLPALSGVSNSTSFTASPLPDFLIPATIPWQEHAIHGADNEIEQAIISVVLQAGSNVLLFTHDANSVNGWTPSGHKGVGLQVITVFLD